MVITKHETGISPYHNVVRLSLLLSAHGDLLEEISKSPYPAETICATLLEHGYPDPNDCSANNPCVLTPSVAYVDLFRVGMSDGWLGLSHHSQYERIAAFGKFMGWDDVIVRGRQVFFSRKIDPI